MELNAERSAGYGLACEACVKAKAKCTRPSGPSATCGRCQRLQKLCQPSTKRRRLAPDNSRAFRSTVDASSGLERKLDELRALILKPTPTSPPESNPSVQSPAQYPQHDEPTLQEAEECLTTFRDCHSRFIPFVYLPITVTAQQLRQERPLLLDAIVSVACKSTKRQESRGKRLRHVFAQEMLVKNEPSIDVLLALLVFVTWAHLQISNDKLYFKTTVCTFTNLTISAVLDLGLQKPVVSEPSQSLCILQAYGFAPDVVIRTKEQRRAVLGTFLISSAVSSTIKVVDSLRWTPHMEDCLRELETHPEHPNDSILVQQVKLQLAAERASLARWYETAIEPRNTTRMPQVMYPQALIAHLDEIQTAGVPELQHQIPIRLHLYGAQVSVHEVALSDDPQIRAPQHDGVSLPSMARLRHLHGCLLAIRSWTDTFFSLTPAEMRGIPTFLVLQLRHCMGMLFILSTLDDPSWNKADVRATADVVAIINRLCAVFRKVAEASGIDADCDVREDMWTLAAARLQGLATLWASKLDPHSMTPIDMNIPPATGENYGLFTDWSDLDLGSLNWSGSTSAWWHGQSV